MTIERWQSKAASYRAGWREVFGVDPTDANTALGLSVAEHETRCGDAWPGEFNWGAVQVSAAEWGGPDFAKERVVLGQCELPKSIAEIKHAVADARAALDAAGLKWNGLHVDTSPRLRSASNPIGAYWIFFRVFDDDAAGAAHFIKTLAKARTSCRAVLERGGTGYELAGAMYASKYFEGFRKPGSYYARTNGSWREVPAGTPGAITGKELNVLDYGGALVRLVPGVAAALAPTASVRPTLRRGSRGEDVKFVQRVVGVTEDGIFGRLTEAAVIHWQLSNHLTADGIVGRNTWAAMESK